MKKLLSILTLVVALNAEAQMQEGEAPGSVAPGTEEAPLELSSDPSGGDQVNLMDKKTKYNNNDPIFRDIAKEFRCPTCTGLSVLESDAGFSVQIKEQVQEQLNLGKNHDQIKEYFTARYGAWILREPPAKGFNVLAWAIPITLLLAGPILIWLMVWKRHVKTDSHGVRSATVILQEMQENIQRMKRENA